MIVSIFVGTGIRGIKQVAVDAAPAPRVPAFGQCGNSSVPHGAGSPVSVKQCVVRFDLAESKAAVSH